MFSYDRGMKRGADDKEVEKEAAERAEKSRPEHWKCQQCQEEKTGSGFQWIQTVGYVCNTCVAKAQK